MKVLVVDAQGGGIGRQLVAELKSRKPDLELMAVGTNSAAALAMKKAGADVTGTGENSVLVAARKADVITGPIGIVLADSMLGEVTPAMAAAVAASGAKLVLIPFNRCDCLVAGVGNTPLSALIKDAAAAIIALDCGA